MLFNEVCSRFGSRNTLAGSSQQRRSVSKSHLKFFEKSCIASLVAAGLMVGSIPALAEEPVSRTGLFAEPGISPRCDGALETIASVGDFVEDGVTYLGEKAIETTVAMGELAQGNPDALLDSVNDTFSDVSEAAVSLTEFTPLGLTSYLIDVLPDGSFTSFLNDGLTYLQAGQQAVVAGVVSGANPVKLAETALNDLDEIAGDILKVVENLDDPLNAANEFFQLQQKWTGAGALTYMFTEKDPMTGLKKALSAMHRQVEIVTTYSGGVAGALTPSADVQSALLGHAMGEAKKYIDTLPDGSSKQAATVLAATFSVAYRSEITDPNFDPNNHVARHPLFLAEVRNVELKWLGNDHNTGGKYDFGLQHPVVENKPGCISLGDRVYSPKIKTQTAPAVCGVENGRDVWWSRPIDYKVIWGSNCAGGSHDLSVWQPVCKPGYVSVGVVAHNTPSGIKPLPNAIACLKNDPRILNVTDGQQAGIQWVANDRNSGSKFDGTFYERDFLGMNLMHAIGGLEGYKGGSDSGFVKSLRVAVPARGTAPSQEKAHCVNFYSEPFYGGWTQEACNLDARTDLANPSTGAVLHGYGVSSFQCGPEVAGVEVLSTSGASKIINCDDGGTLGLYDGFDSIVTMLSSYVSPNGATVKAPKTIENEKLVAQKAERDRIAQLEAIERANQFVSDSKNQCENFNDGNSCLNLGLVYSTGTPNIPQDIIASTFYLNRSCEIGDSTDGCTQLRTVVAESCGNDSIPAMCTRLAGIYYLDSLPGVDSDYPRARGLYDLSCNFITPTDAFACRRYGDMQRNGVGGETDLEGSYNSYRTGCELDEGYSCINMGNYFREAVFVDKDLNAARDYYDKACELGINEGCDSVIRVNNQQKDEEQEAARIQAQNDASADTDSDGMPDVYERINTFDLSNASDASEDYDQDGVSNLDEYRQGTDPRDFIPNDTETPAVPAEVVSAGNDGSSSDGIDTSGGGNSSGEDVTGGGDSSGGQDAPTGGGVSSGGSSGGGGGSTGFFILALLALRLCFVRRMSLPKA